MKTRFGHSGLIEYFVTGFSLCMVGTAFTNEFAAAGNPDSPPPPAVASVTPAPIPVNISVSAHYFVRPFSLISTDRFTAITGFTPGRAQQLNLLRSVQANQSWITETPVSVRVLSYDNDAIRIKVLTGPHAEQTGWIAYGSIAEGNCKPLKGTYAGPINSSLLTLNATRHVWVEVSDGADGSLFRGFMEAGDRRTFDCKKGIRIRAGNGGSLLWTQELQQRFGPPGQVVEKSFFLPPAEVKKPRATLKVVEKHKPANLGRYGLG